MKTVNELHLEVLEKAVIECADVEQLLGDLEEGDMTQTLKDRVCEHLEGCRCCSESRKSYQWVIRKARMLKPEPMPADVSRRLRMALNERLGISLSVDSEGSALPTGTLEQ